MQEECSTGKTLFLIFSNYDKFIPLITNNKIFITVIYLNIKGFCRRCRVAVLQFISDLKHVER